MNQNDLLAWCDDFHQVKGNVSQLQATLNHILSKAPMVSQYETIAQQLESNISTLDPQLVERCKSLLLSPQLKVAVRLKHLFDRGYLPLLFALSRINFKSVNADRFVGYLLDYNPPKSVLKRMPEILKKHVPMKGTPVTDNYPPSLPPISDQDLLKLVLTDKTYRQPLKISEVLDFHIRDNRKLSLKGKTLLKLCLLELLEEKFPDIHEDDLLFLLEKLLAKYILCKLAYAYNLPELLYHNVASDFDSIDTKVDVFSNVFLAYIAGLSADDYSHLDIKNWLGKLFDPIMLKLVISNKDQDNLKDVHQLAFNELNFLLKRVDNVFANPTKRIGVEYEVFDEDPYVVKVIVGNDIEATGDSATSKDRAKFKACYNLLNSPDKMNELLQYITDHLNERESIEPENEQSDSPDAEDDYDPELQAPQAQTNETSSIPAIPPQKPPTPQPQRLPQPAPKPFGLPPNPATRVPMSYNSLPPNPNSVINGRVAPYAIQAIGNDVALRLPIDHLAKNNLYSLLSTKNMNPTYRSHKVGNDYQATITVNDVVLGVAYDTNKKVASQKAAMNALENKQALMQLGIDS